MIIVGILVNSTQRPEKFIGNKLFFSQLAAIGPKCGVLPVFCHARSFNFNLRKVNGYYFDIVKQKWKQSDFSLPKVVYNRFATHGRKTLQEERNYALNGLRRCKIPVFNPYLGDKWQMHQFLSSLNGIKEYIPLTIPLDDVKRAVGLLDRWESVYLKPKSGSQGRGIIRITNDVKGCFIVEKSGQKVVKSFTRKSIFSILQVKAKKKYLMQKTIESAKIDDKIFDLRILVQKDGAGKWQYTGGAARLTKEGITCNLHMGADVISLERTAVELDEPELPRKLKEIALMFAANLDKVNPLLGELGLDFIVDGRGKIWFIEANPKPGRYIFEKLGDKNTRQLSIVRPLEYAKYLARRQGR